MYIEHRYDERKSLSTEKLIDIKNKMRSGGIKNEDNRRDTDADNNGGGENIAVGSRRRGA